MICPELFSVGTDTKVVDFGNYRDLDRERKRLVQSWWKRAKKVDGLSKHKDFEPFIFAWFAFNAWGMCVTGAANDEEMIKSLALNADLDKKFGELIAKSNSKFTEVATNFINLLPIFDVKELTTNNLLRWDDQNRRDRVLFYLTNGAVDFKPQCWRRHLADEANGQPLPLDWAHTLRAIYKVRCNLFHGNKSAYIENDKKIVRLAFVTLHWFMGYSNYLR